MAILHARNQLAVDETIIARSIIGSTFAGKILRQFNNSLLTIMPEISGRAWITGTYQHYLDPSDPWPQGYRISDTWPVRLV